MDNKSKWRWMGWLFAASIWIAFAASGIAINEIMSLDRSDNDWIYGVILYTCLVVIPGASFFVIWRGSTLQRVSVVFGPLFFLVRFLL